MLRMAVPLVVVWAVVTVVPPAAVAAIQHRVPQGEQEIRLTFAPVVKKVAPAVVNIYAARKVVVRSPLFADPFFRRFLGRDFAFGMPRERIQRSLGSGVLVREDGLVVTNTHVIGDADVIRVVLVDRREFDAEVLLADKRTDLAVLRLKAKAGTHFPVVPLGDSDAVEVGDIVLAIGNPFGIGQTVTSGIISATARTNIGTSDFGFYLQTDAAINPGNSGGALVGLDGRLVGINAAIFSRTGESAGIGFAIPVNMVKTVLLAATHGGEIVRNWLGAAYQPVTPELAEALGLDRPGGVLVRMLAQDGPAARAGLKEGDVIVAINGHEVLDEAALKFRLATYPAGSRVTVTILREGERLDVPVVLEPLPDEPPAQPTTLKGRNPFQGVTFGNLSPRLADKLGLDPLTRGVVVLKVDPRAPAAQLGWLRPGDVVEEAAGHAIHSVADLVALDDLAWEKWPFRLRRGRERLACVVYRSGAVDCRSGPI
ncbi:MAG: Do family serine endopeptidase [Alphaproteobacteria bacterium]|nr:MAG: Do family serine endopeptidase [Alphaproteobacteria bacterium]